MDSTVRSFVYSRNSIIYIAVRLVGNKYVVLLYLQREEEYPHTENILAVFKL